MGVDPNNINIDWSSLANGANSTVNTITSSATGTTQNPLITSCTEGANRKCSIVGTFNKSLNCGKIRLYESY